MDRKRLLRNPLIWILVVILVIGILIYNGLVQRRLRIDEAFAQIDVQLKRRHDLIPNLVNAVKVAADPASRGRGCLLVMNDTIFNGRDVKGVLRSDVEAVH